MTIAMLPGHTPGQIPPFLRNRQTRERRPNIGGRLVAELSDIHTQLLLSVALLVALFVVGTLGFWLLGTQRSLFDAAYLTAHTLTTVGDSNRRLSHPEEWWELVLMLAGIIAALYAGGNVVAFLIGGELNRLLGRRQLQRRINQLENHFIVCGFGRMGRVLCNALAAANADFILIELDADLAAEAEAQGYLYVQGDAMTEDRLRDARIEQARGLASCLSSDADNVFVTLTARGLNEKLTLIARAEHVETEHKLRRAGADRVICPPVLSANRVMTMMLHPAVDELMELAVSGADLEISKVSVAQLPAADGKALRELSLPSRTGLMVVAIVSPDGRRRFNPPPDTVLSQGDEMIVIGPNGGVAKMTQLLGEEQI